MLVEGFLKKRKHVKSIHILTCSFQALRRSLRRCKSSNAKLLFSLGKTCTKSHETWNISKVVSTFSMAREKLSAWKDAWDASNPPKMLGVSAFGELHRDGHIKYLAISSASWRPLLKFSQVSFPKTVFCWGPQCFLSVSALSGLLCPPPGLCFSCLRSRLPALSPDFVSRLVPACLSLVSGLVSQLVSLVWDAVSAYPLVFLLSPPVLSPILSRLVFLLFLVLSPSLSPWSGMLYLPTRLCFSCLPRFCLPSCPGLSFSCFWSCLLACLPGLGCCICLPACVSLVSPGFVSHLVSACLSLVSGLVSQLVSLVWDAVSAYPLVFLLSPPVLSPILSRLVFLLFLVLSPSLSPWSGMLCLPTRLCFSCLPRFCLPSCPGLSFSCFWSCLPACLPGLGCCIRLPACVSLVSPGFVSHLVPACLSLVSGLVSQLVSLVWDAVSAYPLVFLLSPPVLSPILSRLVFLLFLVLSPSLSPWSGMLYLPTRLCFSCLPRFCLPSCPGLSFSCFWSCLLACLPGLGCCVCLPACVFLVCGLVSHLVRIHGLVFLSAGLGCRDRLSSWSGISSLPRTACFSPTV